MRHKTDVGHLFSSHLRLIGALGAVSPAPAYHSATHFSAFPTAHWVSTSRLLPKLPFLSVIVHRKHVYLFQGI